MALRIRYRPSLTARLFHHSKAFVRGIRGPIGSGKSVTCVMELWRMARDQAPDANGVRYTRFAIIRNTYPELKSTTIKTWQQWVPDSICPIKYDAPINGLMVIPHPDGKTTIHCEVLFLALDREADAKKLLSLELTAAWINEARELSWGVVKMVRSRVGRFPAKFVAPLTQAGVLLDTNPPDSDHWWYHLAEEKRLGDEAASIEDFQFFHQPGALLKTATGRYVPNPAAENVENQPLGYRYWLNQIGGNTSEWIKVYVLGQYGYVQEGKPIYPEYRDDMHCRDNVAPIPGLALLLGWDFGLTPACVISQVTPRGALMVIDELCSDGMGIRQFARDVVTPYLGTHYPLWPIREMSGSCDPAGMKKSETDERSCVEELHAAQFEVAPAPTNLWTPRREAVAYYLTTMIDGQPAFLMSPRCKTLRRGFNGKYHYRRMQVPGKELFRDEPDKDEFSHCFVGDTAVATPDGERRIDSLRVGDVVCTPIGPRRVVATMDRPSDDLLLLEFSNGRHVVCTSDHPFIVGDRKVIADALQYSDVLESIAWEGQQNTPYKSSMAFGTTESRAATFARIAATTCTAMFGAIIEAIFPRAMTFTTSTGTRATIASRTLNALTGASTLLDIAQSACRPVPSKQSATWMPFAAERRNGIGRMKGASGTESMALHRGATANERSADAGIAERLTAFCAALRRRVFVRRPASLMRAERVASTTRFAGALSAAPSSPSTSTVERGPAVRLVGKQRLAGLDRVYDLTVEDAHSFYAAGVLVSNCQDALQYIALRARGGIVTSEGERRSKPADPRRPIAGMVA